MVAALCLVWCHPARGLISSKIESDLNNLKKWEVLFNRFQYYFSKFGTQICTHFYYGELSLSINPIECSAKALWKRNLWDNVMRFPTQLMVSYSSYIDFLLEEIIAVLDSSLIYLLLVVKYRYFGLPDLLLFELVLSSFIVGSLVVYWFFDDR